MPNMNSDFFGSSNFLLFGGQLLGGRCICLVVGCLVVGAFVRWSVAWCLVVSWSVGRWSVVGGLLVGCFKETRAMSRVCVAPS